MEFNIEHSGSRFEIAVSGAFDHQKYEELVDTLLAHADWKPGSPILVDEIAMDASKASSASVRACAEACTRRRTEFGRARIAFVVARGLEFGMNRMWLAYTRDQWDVSGNVFRSRAEASGWISDQQELPADAGGSLRTTDAEAGSPAMGETNPEERTSS